jgi:lipopolysaccharide biosynthesis glycosyltransferase
MMIACAVDEPYAEMAGVMLRSLSIKGDVRDMPVYLVGDGLGIEVVRDLHECATDLDFHFVDLAAMRAKISNLPASFYNPAIYIRLLLPDLIEGDGRILYLDSDILINGPIRDLLLTPLARRKRAVFQFRRLDVRPADMARSGYWTSLHPHG